MLFILALHLVHTIAMYIILTEDEFCLTPALCPLHLVCPTVVIEMLAGILGTLA